MSTSALTTVDEYLKLDVKPYCEYVDGVLYQKPVPTSYHSLIQMLLGALLTVRAQQFYALSEVHVRIRPGKYLVPDIAVVRRELFERPYPTKPVFLCIEIASPEDRPGQLLAKCEDYHQWGVPHCWYRRSGTPDRVDLRPGDRLGEAERSWNVSRGRDRDSDYGTFLPTAEVVKCH